MLIGTWAHVPNPMQIHQKHLRASPLKRRSRTRPKVKSVHIFEQVCRILCLCLRGSVCTPIPTSRLPRVRVQGFSAVSTVLITFIMVFWTCTQEQQGDMAKAMEHCEDALLKSTSEGPGRVPLCVAWSGWPGLGDLRRWSLRVQIETTFERVTSLFACAWNRVCVC